MSSSDGNRSGRFIAIGIDFGTTYSGVSWAVSENPNDIYEISGWPSESYSNQVQEQVPTQIDIESGKWGFEVTRDMDPVRWLKLLLLKEEDILREEIRDAKPLKSARHQLQSEDALTAIKLVGLYLEKLWNHTYAELKSRLAVDHLPLRVAMTVPAIWPPYAQEAMREAAEIAGILVERDIGSTTLTLVQEPEAAGLSTLFEREKFPEIEIGESFVVCDAGGGTIDIISYMVESKSPFKIKECVKGDGKLAGAFRVDEAFEAHIRNKTKLRISTLDHGEYNAFVNQDWEAGAKRSFKGDPQPDRFFLRPPLKAFGKINRFKGKTDFFLTKEEMKGFFNKSMTSIRSLISDQMREVKAATGKEPKKIFLVGGLGNSPYVYNVLQSQYDGAVLRPLKPWSAVAHGAVIKLLRANISEQSNLTTKQTEAMSSMPEVTLRKSRYSYGIKGAQVISGLSDFDPELDVVSLDAEGLKRADRMIWYLKKGEDIVGKSPITLHYHQHSQNGGVNVCVFQIYYCATDIPPKRIDSTVLSLCRIECEFDRPFSEWRPVGDPKEGWRRYDDLVLAMQFNGEPEWKLQVGKNKTEVDVNVAYTV